MGKGLLILLAVMTLFVGLAASRRSAQYRPLFHDKRASDTSQLATVNSQLQRTASAAATPATEALTYPSNFIKERVGKTSSVQLQHFPVPVLTYHYIRIPDKNDGEKDLSVTPDDFRKQMDYLQTHGFHTITLDEYKATQEKKATLPSKPVIIVLDDGYVDAHDTAFPILKERGMKAMYFIVTGYVGHAGYLTWAQIDEMENSGLIIFGAHTINHPKLTALPLEQAKREITESKAVLQQHVGYPINWFAYPYGNVDAAIVKLTKEAGYAGALGTDNKHYFDSNIMYSIPRIFVSGTSSLEEFEKKLP